AMIKPIHFLYCFILAKIIGQKLLLILMFMIKKEEKVSSTNSVLKTDENINKNVYKFSKQNPAPFGLGVYL
uniref:hypothetical protein n=1 Tax=Chryseobacterium sp. Marseille-Q3244 TaxID=2758092 RepID=UPI0020251C84